MIAASYGAGWVVTGGGRVARDDALLRRSTVFAAGFVATSSLALLLGVAGVFHASVLTAVVGALAVVGLAVAARDLRGIERGRGDAGRERRLLAATAAIVLVDAVLAAAPPTSGDATAYHLTAPKLWLDWGAMHPIWWDWATFQPFGVEMQYAYAMAVSGGRAAMVVGAFLSGLAAVPVYGLGRELAGRTVGAVAVFLWVGQGVFLWEATGAFVEVVVGGLLALAAWYGVRFARRARPADALLAGVALGAAATTKYHALLAVPVLAVVVLWTGRGRRAVALAAFAAGCAVALPWYVKNWVEAGNPLYPLATSVFGGKLWSANDAAWFNASYSPYGPTAWWKAPLFPLFFLLEPDRYERGYAFGLALFAFAPVGAFLGRRWARVFAVVIVGYLVVWTVSLHQITRYLLLVLPLAAVLAGLGLVRTFARGGWVRGVAIAIAAATGTALTGATALLAWQVGPGVAGTEPRGAFVQRLTGTYDALHFLDTRLPPGRVLVVGMRNLYWLDRPYVASYPPLLAPDDPVSLVLRRMRQYHVRYLAALAGTPAPALERELALLDTLAVPRITSRTLARRDGVEALKVYAWCPAFGGCVGARQEVAAWRVAHPEAEP